MDATDLSAPGLAQAIELPEAIELLQAMPAFLEAAVDGASAERLRRRPGPDDFSLLEQACHLGDLEREGYRARVRRMLGRGEAG